MSNDKDKLLRIMTSLESDYKHGKISKEKYIYFRSKYEDKLNSLDAREATSRIRSMQGKPASSYTGSSRPTVNDKKEEQDLVQKYIINPKKGDRNLENTPMDSGTFKLFAILILAIGFTVGAGFGVFNFDFESFSESNAVAIVTDTAFPDVDDVFVNTTATTNTSDTGSSNIQVETVEDTSSYSSSQESQSYSSSQSQSSSSSGGGSSSSSSYQEPSSSVETVVDSGGAEG